MLLDDENTPQKCTLKCTFGGCSSTMGPYSWLITSMVITFSAHLLDKPAGRMPVALMRCCFQHYTMLKYPQTGLTKNMAPGHCNSCTCTAGSIMRMLIWTNCLRHQSLRFASKPQYRKNKTKWQQQNYKRIQLYKVSHHLYMWGWLFSLVVSPLLVFNFSTVQNMDLKYVAVQGPYRMGPCQDLVLRGSPPQTCI